MEMRNGYIFYGLLTKLFSPCFGCSVHQRMIKFQVFFFCKYDTILMVNMFLQYLDPYFGNMKFMFHSSHIAHYFNQQWIQ